MKYTNQALSLWHQFMKAKDLKGDAQKQEVASVLADAAMLVKHTEYLHLESL